MLEENSELRRSVSSFQNEIELFGEKIEQEKNSHCETKEKEIRELQKLLIAEKEKIIEFNKMNDDLFKKMKISLKNEIELRNRYDEAWQKMKLYESMIQNLSK